MPSGLAAYLKYSPEVSCPGSVPCALRDPGQISGNIRQAGKEESWVHRALLRQGYREERDVLLALWDGGEKLTVFPMEPSAPKGQTERL